MDNDKVKKIETSFYEDLNIIAEQIYNKDTSTKKLFAIYNKADESVTHLDEIELEDYSILIPIQSETLIDNGIVLLPSRASLYASEKELIEDIKRFIHKYLDISERNESIVAHYILMTWVYDRLSVVPYLRAIGDYGTGKTRFIQTVGSLCYKPLSLAGATSDAYIFRVIEVFNGTLIINEFDRVETKLQSQITIILNNGYEKDMPVGRVEGDRKKELRTFKVFCPKIFSNRKPFGDQALESRIISISMRPTTRYDILELLDDTFKKEAEQIRNKLLYYRFKNLNLLMFQEEENLRKRKLLSKLEPRMRQTLLPLLYVITSPFVEKEFLEYAHEHQLQLVDMRGQEIPGLIFQKLHELYRENNAKVTVKEVTILTNKEIEKEAFKLTSQKVGKIIRGDLGLNTHKGSGGLYFIDFNEKQMEYLITRYGIESPLSPLAPPPNLNSKVDLVEHVDLGKAVSSEFDMYDKPRTEADGLPPIDEQVAIDQSLLNQGFDFNKD